MIPKKFAPVLFAVILSGNMSLLISGIATYSAAGLIHDFTGLWVRSWLMAWGLAFPVVLVVAPLARRLVGALVAKD
ncbi:MAG TPA: DUF2798 domain-containing protein [Burkholderiales bacterium]|jgi:hypothetical protein|nr:DUF2798 domain-containing protein [Burkholderiales bacterium]